MTVLNASKCPVNKTFPIDKAAISEYLLEPGRFETASILSAGWFLENAFDPKYTAAFGGFATIPDAEGFLTYRVPAMGNDPESVPWLAVADDYGDFVHGVFLDPERWNRQYIHGVSESASFAELTAKFQKRENLSLPAHKVDGRELLIVSFNSDWQASPTCGDSQRRVDCDNGFQDD